MWGPKSILDSRPEPPVRGSMTPAEIVIASSASTGVTVCAALWLARNLILERLRGAVRHEYDVKLEVLRSDLSKQTDAGLTELRSQLEREAADEIARLRSELDVLREKELSGHKEKLNAYRLVTDVFSETYTDLQIAFESGEFGGVRSKYNRCWTQCYGYLSMVAPQEVMDAFDGLNDYVLTVLAGRQAPMPWPETRILALRLINCMRHDIGLSTGSLDYHGEL